MGIWRWLVRGGVLFGLVLGGTFGARWAGQSGASGYACLRITGPNDDRYTILDVYSGLALPDRATPLKTTGAITRGAASSDGRWLAYLSRVNGQPTTLYVGATDGDEADRPEYCSGHQDCWADRPGAPAQALQAGTNHALGLGWSPDGRLALAWVNGKGELNVAAYVPLSANVDSDSPAMPSLQKIAQRHVLNNQLVANTSIYFHGWSEDGRYAAFTTYSPSQPNHLYFWEPDTGRLIDYPATENNPPNLTFRWHDHRLAYLTNDFSSFLVVADPDTASEWGYPISVQIETLITWSENGRWLAVRYFDPPNWRVDVYEVGGGLVRDPTGVQPSDTPNQRSDRPFVRWIGDRLVLSREKADGSQALVAFDPASGVWETLADNLLYAPNISATGSFAVVTGVADGSAPDQIYVFDSDGRLRAHHVTGSEGQPDRINRVLWQAGGETVLLATIFGDFPAEKAGFQISLLHMDGSLQVLMNRLSEELIAVTLDQRMKVTIVSWASDTADPSYGGVTAFDARGVMIHDFRAGGVVSSYNIAPNGQAAELNIVSGLVEKPNFLQFATANAAWTSAPLRSGYRMGIARWAPDSNLFAASMRNERDWSLVWDIYTPDAELIRTFTPLDDLTSLEWIPCAPTNPNEEMP